MLGPYDTPPLQNLFCSPLNMVPKVGNPGKFRLIHDLTYPYNADSINMHIPDEEAKVKYESFDKVVALGLKHRITAFAAKTDFLSAFCNFPVSVDNLIFLGFTLQEKYFINSSVAFSSRSSCKIFEEFACAVQYIHEKESHLQNISHYLDDFIVVDKSHKKCSKLLKKLQKISGEIGAPLSPEKTEKPTQEIIYLGMLLNFKLQVISIPADKITKALQLIENAISVSRGSGKMRVQQTSLALTKEQRDHNRQHKTNAMKPNPNFHVRVNKEAQKDLLAWQKFLQNTDSMARTVLFLHLFLTGGAPELITDASRVYSIGCIFKCRFTHTHWPAGFTLLDPNNSNPTRHREPSIMLLELIAVVVGLEMWVPCMARHQIVIRSDNQGVVQCINKRTSKCPFCMSLICRLTLLLLNFQILLVAKYLPGILNQQSDQLSRGQISAFLAGGQGVRSQKDLPSPTIWPISWQKLSD